jgi:hypothetical protein
LEPIAQGYHNRKVIQQKPLFNSYHKHNNQ